MNRQESLHAGNKAERFCAAQKETEESTTPPPAVPPLLSFLLFHQDDYRKKQEDAEWMELSQTTQGEPAGGTQTSSKGAQTYFLFLGKTSFNQVCNSAKTLAFVAHKWFWQMCL